MGRGPCHTVHNVLSFNHKTRLKEEDLTMVLVSSTKPTKGEKTMETQEEKGRQNKKKQETTLLGKIEKQDSKL